MHDLIFLATSRVDNNRSFLDKYLAGYATIQFSPHGGVEVGYGERWYSLTGGAWFWPAHPGERIRFRPARGYQTWPHRHVGFRGALIEEWRAGGLWLETPQAAPPSRSPAQWDEYFHQWSVLAQRQDALGRRRAINMLENLLLELADARQKSRRGEALEYSSQRAPWLPHVLELLSNAIESASAPPDYPGIARDLRISEATLRRHFKTAMGVSPHDYFLRSRADAARVLLRETNLPLKAVATRLGYENEYFFSRQFKQFAGVSPGVYRKSRLQSG